MTPDPIQAAKDRLTDILAQGGIACASQWSDISPELRVVLAELSRLVGENERLAKDGALIGWKAALDCIQYCGANWAQDYRSENDRKTFRAAVDALTSEIVHGEPTEWLDVVWKAVTTQTDALEIARDALAEARRQIAEALAVIVGEDLMTPIDKCERVAALLSAPSESATQEGDLPELPSGSPPEVAVSATAALASIIAERQRQIDVEGWSIEHDDQHGPGRLSDAAAAYAQGAMYSGVAQQARQETPPFWWPWHVSWWKPRGGRTDLVRAGALIVAEIERIDRTALASQSNGGSDA